MNALKRISRIFFAIHCILFIVGLQPNNTSAIPQYPNTVIPQFLTIFAL